MLERIQIGDTQAVRDERAGARAAARADGDPVLARPPDEVRDDQEIPGEPHLTDNIELHAQPLAVLAPLGGIEDSGQSRLEATQRLGAHEVLGRGVSGYGIFRQPRLA